ncbi:MAG: hypothetical protein HRU28_03195 [Rhizobiales bacterium]|nr:hypothetical protein [Hyphomicrobiales bacterium]
MQKTIRIIANGQSIPFTTVATPEEAANEIAEYIAFEAEQGRITDGGELTIDADDLAAWHLALHAKKVGAKVGVILSSKTKNLQTQSNIQAKFSMIDTKSASNRTAQEKAIHAAILALSGWVGEVMALGKTLKQNVNADIETALWPELDAQSSAVIAALVEEL